MTTEMTPEEQYAHTLGELVEAMHRWGEAHAAELVDIDFPEYVVIGTLEYIPGEWLKNEPSRQLIQYLSKEVPEATIEQLRTICEGIAEAEANAQKTPS